MEIRVEVTTDMDLVKSIISIPEIWERAAEDGVDKDMYMPSHNNMTGWLVCKKGDDIVGIILAHIDNSASVKIHPYLKKEFRFLGRDVMKKFYEWFLSLPEAIHKIVISIPENQRKVYNFAKKIGFIDEGFNRESYRKNDIIYGQYCLGITRNEIEEYLK